MVLVKPVEAVAAWVGAAGAGADVVAFADEATEDVCFFLCDDLCTTGVPSEFVEAFVVCGAGAALGETTVTSSSARPAFVPRARASAAMRAIRRAASMLGGVVKGLLIASVDFF
jgi:hypothetical protein